MEDYIKRFLYDITLLQFTAKNEGFSIIFIRQFAEQQKSMNSSKKGLEKG
jgi:hypothetical protein